MFLVLVYSLCATTLFECNRLLNSVFIPVWLHHVNLLSSSPFKKAVVTSIWCSSKSNAFEMASTVLIDVYRATGANTSS